MSKIEKFLSIEIDILQGIEKFQKEQFDADLEHMNAGRMYQAMQAVEANLLQKNIRFTGTAKETSQGKIKLTVINDEKKGIPAQVKLFPLLPGETIENYNRVNGKINMIRETTDDKGCVELTLPYNQYVVEISKGSEYEILTTAIQISKKDNGKKEYTLHRFINLEEQGFFAGDLHHHSIFSSPVYGGDDDVKETPAQVANSMKAMGLRFGALSDHHNVLNHKEWKKQESEDFYPVVSKEISTSNGHVLALGVEHDVIYHIPKEEDRTDEVLRAEFRRITKEIQESGGLPQLNHPRDLSRSISWNPDFYDMIDIFETMEIWNGSNPMYYGTTNQKAASLWRDLLDQGRYIPATTGSDTHNIRANDYHSMMDEIIWLADQIKSLDPESAIATQYADEIKCFQLIVKQLLPLMEKWAETNLTSGGVRTYIQLPKNLNTPDILQALRSGHSFLTNGPILIPKINGAGCGEKISREESKDTDRMAELQIQSNKPLKHLYVYGSRNFEKKYPLTLQKEGNGYYDYSMTVKMEREWNCDWVFFVAADDCTTLAITNPIFLKE